MLRVASQFRDLVTALRRRRIEWTFHPGIRAYREWRERLADEIARRRSIERSLCGSGEGFGVDAECWVCARSVSMSVDYRYSYELDGHLTPNWREQLRCPDCGMNNRMRASLHFVAEVMAPRRSSSIYLTEQLSPVYDHLYRRYSDCVGSESLGQSVPLGAHDARGLRNEDACALTFTDERFDLVASFEVLEHVPEYLLALREMGRVLRRGGSLLLSTPFDPECEMNLVRAVPEPGGTVRHLLPPEYHGDPLRAEGCLAYRRFGWELLDDLRDAGFVDCGIWTFWSRRYGYLGDPLLFVVARRGA